MIKSNQNEFKIINQEILTLNKYRKAGDNQWMKMNNFGYFSY